ncbi:MAG: hypothetical protein D6739_05260 [Nitrospirae bacterium]|nr:MAG: hypothetical protein D6739_05260 [Nitrospirota bacterium]
MLVVAAAFPAPEEQIPSQVVVWIAPSRPVAREGTPLLLASEVDLRPYFRDGDPAEVDLYQGLLRHLREGYAFPVRGAA